MKAFFDKKLLIFMMVIAALVLTGCVEDPEPKHQGATQSIGAATYIFKEYYLNISFESNIANCRYYVADRYNYPPNTTFGKVNLEVEELPYPGTDEIDDVFNEGPFSIFQLKHYPKTDYRFSYDDKYVDFFERCSYYGILNIEANVCAYTNNVTVNSTANCYNLIEQCPIDSEYTKGYEQIYSWTENMLDYKIENCIHQFDRPS